MITQALCQSFKLGLLNGVHNFTTDTFKIALYTSLANLSDATTVYTPVDEIASSNYVAGGATLTKITPVLSNGIAITSFATASWTGITASIRGALIYNADAANATVMVLDFGYSATVTNGPFSVTFPSFNSSDAILRIE